MKPIFNVFLLILATSCQVSETITVNNDGSGNIVVDELRDENFFNNKTMYQFKAQKENEFVDTTYVFKDIIVKYESTYNKFLKADRELLQRYKNVVTHIKKDSYNNEYRDVFELNFKNCNEIPNIFNTEKYKNSLHSNHVLTNGDFYTIDYSFNGTIFKRIVKIINSEEAKKEFDDIDDFKKMYSKFNPIQSFQLHYSFARKIKSVSNLDAKISDDKKSMTLYFLISDCLQNPEITSLEVVLE